MGPRNECGDDRSGGMIHLSMSVGHGFAGGENGNAVSGGSEKKRRVAWTQALADMPVG